MFSNFLENYIVQISGKNYIVQISGKTKGRLLFYGNQRNLL